jgi:hypothetical protein
VIAQPRQRAADEAQRFAGSCRRFEDTDFAFFQACIDSTHEFILDIVWCVWVVEVSLLIGVVHCAVVSNKWDDATLGRVAWMGTGVHVVYLAPQAW